MKRWTETDRGVKRYPPEYELNSWHSGMHALAGTPKYNIARLNAETVKVMSNPGRKTFMQSRSAEAAGSTPGQPGALHRREFEKWGGVIKAIGVTPE